MAPSAIPPNGEDSHIGNVKYEDRLFINGEFVPSIRGKKFDIESPYLERKVASVYEALPEDVDRAVDAATAAFPSWSELGAFQRAGYLYKLADLLEKAGPELSQLEALSIGRPVALYSMWSTFVASIRVFLDPVGGADRHSGTHNWCSIFENVRWPRRRCRGWVFFEYPRTCQHPPSPAIRGLWRHRK